MTATAFDNGPCAAPGARESRKTVSRTSRGLLLAAAGAAVLAAGCASTIPRRPVPLPEDRRALPAWYPEQSWTAAQTERDYVEGKVVFDTAKWNIREPSARVLGQLVEYMNRNPDVSRMRLEGHTDSRAPDEYNQKLSERRAISVANWLVDHGVDHMRLLAVAFGETRPIAPNDNPVGRQENRRTAFHIAEINGGRFMGKDPTAGGLVLEVKSAEERRRERMRGKVPTAVPEPFTPEGDIIKPAEMDPPKRTDEEDSPSGQLEPAGDG